jgi:hypothetical protein
MDVSGVIFIFESVVEGHEDDLGGGSSAIVR